jgi:Fe-S-cluster containining protein
MSCQAEDEFNGRLARSCQAAGAACCKKGKLFLPLAEYRGIVDWMREHSPAEGAGFESRCVHHDAEGFVLYDQEQACQFLTPDDLCRLHTQGVKPSECFWWPLHVYVTPEDGLEIRVSTSCCEAYKNTAGLARYADEIADKVPEIGEETLRAFRRSYGGSYATLPVRAL